MAVKGKNVRKKTLVIVESPSKAKTIGKYLGPSYKVMASVGHIRDLPKSKLGIDIENDFEGTEKRSETGVQGLSGNGPGPGRRSYLMASGISAWH